MNLTKFQNTLKSVLAIYTIVILGIVLLFGVTSTNQNVLADGCTVTQVGGSIGGHIDVSDGCTNVKVERHSRDMTGPNDGCFTPVVNGESINYNLSTYFTSGPTTVRPDPELCRCVQVDVFNPEGGFTGVTKGNWDDSCANNGGGQQVQSWGCNLNTFTCSLINGDTGYSTQAQCNTNCKPNPSINLIKDVVNNSVAIGENVEFNITITNNGNVDLDNLNFLDEYETAFLSYNAGSGIYTIDNPGNLNDSNGGVGIQTDNGSIEYNFGSAVLKRNGTLSVTLTFTSLASTLGEANIPIGMTRNIASITGDDVFNNPAITVTDDDNADVEITDDIVNQPNMQVVKSTENNQTGFEVGDPVNFIIVLTNNGSENISNIVFTDNYETTYLSYNSNPGGTYVINNNGNQSNENIESQSDNGTLTYNFGSTILEPGDTITLTIPFTTLASTGAETNVPFGQTRNIGIFDAVSTDSNTSLNDQDNADITIDEPQVNNPSLTIDKSFSSGYQNDFGINELVVFAIQIQNNGNTSFDNVSFTDQFDLNFLDFREDQNNTARLNGNTVSVNSNINISGNSLTINNLSQVMGEDLDPGETILLTLYFETLQEGSTQNIAIADTDITTPVQDSQDVIIIDNTNQPGVEVDKYVTDSDATFLVNDTVTYQIQIRNTGQTTLQTISFEDTFDPNYIEINLVNSSITKNTGEQVSNLSSIVNVSNGVMTIADITQVGSLGDLAVNDFYTITFRFRALQATAGLPGNVTTNSVVIVADGVTDTDNEDITILDDTVTIVACNDVCNAANVCDSNQNQGCFNVGGNEFRCRLVTNPQSDTCTPINNETPGIDITKTLANDFDGDGSYIVGEKVRFNIRIENTGNTTFDLVRFQDTFDPNYLRLELENSRIIKNTGVQISDLTNYVTTSGSGSIVIDDITNLPGMEELGPGQFYTLTIQFEALQPVQSTTNTAITTVNDGLQDTDTEDVTIITEGNVNIVQCNNICGTTSICDSNNGLACIGLGNNEFRCRLPENPTDATCGGQINPEADPSLAIDKYALADADGKFSVGEPVTFNVRVLNDGNVDLDDVSFRDNYDANVLNLVSGNITKYNVGNNVTGTISNVFDITTINNPGYLEIANIANSSLGGLQPGEYYIISLTYIIRLPISTTNIAITEGQDTSGEATETVEDRETINIINLNTDL